MTTGGKSAVVGLSSSRDPVLVGWRGHSELSVCTAGLGVALVALLSVCVRHSL